MKKNWTGKETVFEYQFDQAWEMCTKPFREERSKKKKEAKNEHYL